MQVLFLFLACTSNTDSVSQGDISVCISVKDPSHCYGLLDGMGASSERSLAFSIACDANYKDSCARSLAELTDRSPIQRTTMVLAACEKNRDPEICQLAIDFAKQQNNPRFDQVIENGEHLRDEINAGGTQHKR